MVVARLKERFAVRRRPPGAEEVFDPEFFARLDRIRIRFGRAHGRRSGDTAVRGLTQESGIEVEGFKSYSPGDDIRYVDWNAVGRLDQLLTRRFVAEREIPVHVLLDASASMAVPGADGKFPFSVQLAGVLAYLALNNNEPVRIASLRSGADGVGLAVSPYLRHHGRFATLRPFLTALEPSGGTALAEGTRAYLERHKEGGMAFVVSDFLVEEPVIRNTLEQLRSRKLDVWAIQVVGGRESDLEGIWGRFRLRDAESGEIREVSLSEADRRRYRDDFLARIGQLRRLCHGSGIGHVVARTDQGIAHAVTKSFPAEGLVRLR